MLATQEAVDAAQSGQPNDGEITRLKAELKELREKDTDISGVQEKAKQQAQDYDALAQQRKSQKA